jgi:hypothetical protein
MAEDAEGFDFGMKGCSRSSGAVAPIFDDQSGRVVPTDWWIDWQESVAMYIGISIVFGAEILKRTN